jgi:hypothetical protein
MDEAGIENRAGRKKAGPENEETKREGRESDKAEPENIRNGKTEERSERV